MKILHIPISLSGIWEPARLHFENLLTIENHMQGINNYIFGSAESDLEHLLKNKKFDIINFHGWPLFNKSTKYLETVKLALLSKAKVVFSMFTYQIFCQNGLLKDNEVECDVFSCKNRLCQNAIANFNFVKNFDILVYSNAAKDIVTNCGFSKVHKAPMCFYSHTDSFIKPSFNPHSQFKLALLYPGAPFYEDEDIMNQVFDKNKDIIYLKIKNIYNNYDSNYSFSSYSWKTSFPFEIGYSLSKGIIPIYFSQYDINDYEGVQNIYRINKNDLLGSIERIVLTETSEKNRNDMAYNFWLNNGPEYCMVRMQTIYDSLISNPS